ncbi:MAG TPA: metallopeptidase family protein [Candidatus Microsaccharimonas sp.]|jgi:predicted Zn-dependent protease with MMP-like domain
MELTDETFDRLISQAMDELPQEYIKGLNNVAILYADDPDEYQIQKSGLREGNILLGLYEGIPLTKRGGNYSFVLPDKITLFKHSMMMVARDPQQLYEHIKRTLWHEIAHYYGLDHERIHSLERGEEASA